MNVLVIVGEDDTVRCLVWVRVKRYETDVSDADSVYVMVVTPLLEPERRETVILSDVLSSTVCVLECVLLLA